MMILRNLTHKPRASRGLRMRTLLQFDWRPVEEGLQLDTAAITKPDPQHKSSLIN